MFDRFTDRAKRVMNLARQEAERLNHEYLGTEHILLGLVKEGSGVAASVLKQMGIELDRIRVDVERIVRAGPSTVTTDKLPFTPRAKKVLELSLEESCSSGHSHIGTEHLLLGLIKENEGIAGQVFMSLGVRFEDVREEVLDFLEANPVDGEEGASSIDKIPRRVRTPTVDKLGRELTEVARRSLPRASTASDALSVTERVLRHERALIQSSLPEDEIEIQRGRAFVLIPHRPQFNTLFEVSIVPALAAHGLEPVKGNDIAVPGGALPQVWRELRSAEILLAVLTGRDPNVIYELGLCHGIRRCPILLVEKSEDLPFHLLTLRHVQYEDSEVGREKLRKDLTALVGAVLELVRNA